MFTMTKKTHWIHDDGKQILWDEMSNAEKVYSKRDRKTKKPVYYWNIPMAFDIETSSFRANDGTKLSVMYVWQFGINGKVIMGRTWDEFKELMAELELFTDEARALIYVHNLSYEFQFIRKRLEWKQTFSTAMREPIYAVTTHNIEFRDSYILTAKSLAKTAESLHTYKIEKMVGDLDYTLLRGNTTQLTETELGYCRNDVLVLNALIQEKIEEEGGTISKIPLTNTGYIRRYFRELCFPKDDLDAKSKYNRLMCELRINDSTEYQLLKDAYSGGFTHANPVHVNELFNERIDSFDFTSSYPTVMIAEQFPMGRGKYVKPKSLEEFQKFLNHYCSVFDVRFLNIRQKKDVPDSVISGSKCSRLVRPVLNNGRVYSADELITTVTNVDFEVFTQFYDFDSYEVKNMIVYRKAYLPKPIIEGILKLYGNKTKLKGVEGKEVEYMVSKGMLNGVYGMCVTDIAKALITYITEWGEDPVDVDDAIESYNRDRKRFLFYPWGVFVSAYARRNLLMGIKAIGEDYIYSDTDSIKCRNVEQHMDFITWYNKDIVRKLNECLDFYGIDRKETAPETIKGEAKQLGVWDWETEKKPYTQFKTLGAKRYVYVQDGDLHITIAGVNKKDGKDYIAHIGIEEFKDDLVIPAENSGKLTHTYIDEEQSGTFIDYQGNEQTFDELSSVHLEGAEYHLSVTDEFTEFCKTMKEDRYVR